MSWWLWILAGLFLVVLETATPGGFFALFFAISALVLGILTRLGWAGPEWMQWLLFSVLSVLGLLAFRKPLMKAFKLGGPGKVVDGMAGESALVTEDVPGEGVGKAEMRGTSWSARSASGLPLARGQRCRVERIEGLTLWLRLE
jgi:membrane protein implicated in regulation of membrane protease activity